MQGANVIHAMMDLWSSRAMEPITGVQFQYSDCDDAAVCEDSTWKPIHVSLSTYNSNNSTH